VCRILEKYEVARVVRTNDSVNGHGFQIPVVSNRAANAVARQMLVEAVRPASRCSSTILADFDRIQRHDKERKRIVAMATAHDLVRVKQSMLVNDAPWTERVAAGRYTNPGQRGEQTEQPASRSRAGCGLYGGVAHRDADSSSGSRRIPRHPQLELFAPPGTTWKEGCSLKKRLPPITGGAFVLPLTPRVDYDPRPVA